MATQNGEETETVNWRLPEDMLDECSALAEDNGTKWADELREVLASWKRRRKHVRPPPKPSPLVNKCIRMPTDTLRALEAEAARLEEKTGETWSVPRVVREVYEMERASA